MKNDNVVTVRRAGEILIGKRAAERLGISCWSWLEAQIKGDYIFMLICKSSPMEIGDHLIRLRDRSSGLRGACLEFTRKIDFGYSNSLDLQFEVVSTGNDECVILKITGESMMESEKNDKGSKELATKEAQAEIARWIRANGCDEVSCSGASKGRFNGLVCPLRASRVQNGGCGRAAREEMFSAEIWLTSNGYSLDQETPLGTISKPSEEQPDILDLSGKVSSSLRTRPLPENIPDWLRTPMSKGLHVEVAAIGREKYGWAIGAFKNTVSGNTLIAVYFDNVLPCAMCFTTELSPASSRLKPAIECYKVAGKLGIGLSALQIEAINSGGVPPENHGLPDEMFE